jgi:NitT/TauT family transport system substrate-binding protein
MKRRGRGPSRPLCLAIAIIIAILFAADARAGEPIKIGLLKLPNGGPVYLAEERGYFAAEGLDPTLVYFEGGQPIAVAAAGHAIDFGITGLTAGLYSLAGQGALRIVAGGYNEVPGFPGAAFLVSDRAYAAGLKSFKDLSGHSFATTVMGSPLHYAVGRLAEKYGFDIKSVRVLPVQSIPNQISALTGGQADSTLLSTTPALPALIERGEIKRLGWLGDETPMQLGATFTATRTADQRHEVVERFLRALRKGASEYHAAFTGANGTRKDGPAAPAVLAVMAKYTGQAPERLEDEIAFVDADERLDVTDVLHQIAWYKSQGLVKPGIDGGPIIDQRYVIPLGER